MSNFAPSAPKAVAAAAPKPLEAPVIKTHLSFSREIMTEWIAEGAKAATKVNGNLGGHRDGAITRRRGRPVFKN